MDYNAIVRSRISRLQNLLEEQIQYKSNPWKRERAQSITHFRGVRIAGIRVAVHLWNQEWKAQCPHIPAQHRVDVTMGLFHSCYLEDKMSAIILIDEVLFNENVIQSYLMTTFSDLFEAGLLSCYEVSDSFSTKVLTGLLIRERQVMMQIISQWFRSSYVWKARSALNSLIPLAKDAIYESLIVEGCAMVLPKREECAKNVVASALRAMSYRSPNTVYTFLSNERNLALMTGPGLTKACGNHQEWKDVLRRRRKEIILQNFNCDFSADIEQAAWNADNHWSASDSVTATSFGYYNYPPLMSQQSLRLTDAAPAHSGSASMHARSAVSEGVNAYQANQTPNATHVDQIERVYPSFPYNEHGFVNINSAQASRDDDAYGSNDDPRRVLHNLPPSGNGQ